MPPNMPDYIDSVIPQSSWRRFPTNLINFALRVLVRWFKTIRVPFCGIRVLMGYNLVQEGFARSVELPVANEAKTDALTWDPPFLLAVERNDANYQQMHADTRDIFADPALIGTLQMRARAIFDNQLDNHQNDTVPLPNQGDWVTIDLPWEYLYPAFMKIVDDYYGVVIEDADRDEFVGTLLVLSSFFFGQDNADKNKDEAQQAFDFAWAKILDQVQQPPPPNSALQRAVAKGLSADTMTSYFLGMILGFIPTNGNGHGRIIETLFDPGGEAMWWAKHHVNFADDQFGDFLSLLHECLRLNYILPGLWRRVETPVTLGAGTPHRVEIKADDRVLLSGLAAMVDPDRHDDPCAVQPDRSYWAHLNYGHQMHYCVGWDVSNIIMVEFFRALVRRDVQKLYGSPRPKWAGGFPWTMRARYKAQ